MIIPRPWKLDDSLIARAFSLFSPKRPLRLWKLIFVNCKLLPLPWERIAACIEAVVVFMEASNSVHDEQNFAHSTVRRALHILSHSAALQPISHEGMRCPACLTSRS